MTNNPNAEGRHGITPGYRLPLWDEASHTDLADTLDELAALAAQLRAPVRDGALRAAQYDEAHGKARWISAVAESLRDDLEANPSPRTAAAGTVTA